jgi:hypothetical protein
MPTSYLVPTSYQHPYRGKKLGKSLRSALPREHVCKGSTRVRPWRFPCAFLSVAVEDLGNPQGGGGMDPRY